MAERPERVVIDCDPGVDDAVAVLMALASPELDVRGLSTVFGNAPVEVTTRNARTLLRAGGRPDLPVARGAVDPLVGRFVNHAAHIHGHDGLGDRGVAHGPDEPDGLLAVDLLRREARAAPGALTILTLGPLTNLALLARIDPEAAAMVGRVVLMGGAALAPGNVNPAAEANVLNDPEAAEIVLAFPWPVTLIGLDVTDRILLGPAHLDAICARHDLLARAVPLYRRFYRDWAGLDGLVAHDPSALAYLLRPDLFETRPMPLRVELQGLGRGKTWALSREAPEPPPGWEGRPPVAVALDADHAAVADLIAERLS